MYRKKGRGWTKHIDFMLLDVLCMQIAFIFSYIWRFGLGNPYIDEDYRILAVAFLFIDFLCGNSIRCLQKCIEARLSR